MQFQKICQERYKHNLNGTDEKYEQIYQRCIEVCSDVKPLIEKIRLIPPPKYGERNILLQKIRSGDRTAKNRLVEMYLRNALSIALEAAEVSSLSLEDIFSETVIGLMERLNCPTENKNYSAFLSKGMRFAAYNYVQKNEVKFMSYKDYCESIKGKYYDGESVMIKHICHIQLQQLLDSAVTTLTDREQRILNLRFGLRNSDKRSYKEIAEMYYIDKNRVRQIERKALHKLKTAHKYRLLEFL